MKKVVTIVVTYNRKVLLKENIEALLKVDYKNNDIFIIDNNSDDGTYDYISSYLKNKKIKYFNTGENLGGAGGFSYGMKKALNYDYDYMWLMDDDTIPEKESLASLINKAKELNNDFSFLGSLVKWTDDNMCLMNIQVISKKWHDNYMALYNGLVPVQLSSFVSFFVKTENVRKVGLPIKEFFIYGDDWEYCSRLNKIGVGYLDIDSKVVHKTKVNESADIISINNDKIKRCYCNFRNLFYMYRKHYSKKDVVKYIFAYFYAIFKVIFKSPNKRAKRIYYMTKGMIAGIFFNPEIEME